MRKRTLATSVLTLTLLACVKGCPHGTTPGPSIRDVQLEITNKAIVAAMSKEKANSPRFVRTLRAAVAGFLHVPVPPPGPFDNDPRFIANLAALAKRNGSVPGNEQIVMIEATPDENDLYPETVAVINSSNAIKCSGVLLDANRVLTVEHCKNIKGIVDVPDIVSVNNQTIPVKVSPPFYVDENRELGLLMLFLKTPLSKVKTRPFATTAEIDSSKTKSLTASGFGLTDPSQLTSPAKREYADIIVVSTDCNGMPKGVPDATAYGCVPMREIVASDEPLNKHTDTCLGDSGGPALVKNSSGVLALAAVTRREVNAVVPCGKGSIFLRVDYPQVQNWIKTTTAP